MAGVGDIFYMSVVGIIAAIFFHAGDVGAAGEHFGDGFDLDITQTASVEKRSPALVSGEQFFERCGLKSETTRQINSRLPAGG